MSDFVIGEVYFRIKYPDRDLNLPLLDTFVYLGDSLSSDEPKGFLYFQPADTYARFGCVLDTAEGDRRVRCISYDEACEEMLTTRAVIAELDASERRRNGNRGNRGRKSGKPQSGSE